MSKAPKPLDLDDANKIGFWDFTGHAVDVISKKYPSIDPVAMATSMALRRAYDIVYYDLHAELKKAGMTLAYPGLRILLVLTVSDKLEMRKISEITGMSRASTSTIVEGLVKDGFVIRVASASDRRSSIVSITESGSKIFERTFLHFNRRETWWMSDLDENDILSLQRILRKMVVTKNGGDELHKRD